VLQVFVPTLVFCLVTQWLGLYVASFLLIAGFMISSGASRRGSRCSRASLLARDVRVLRHRLRRHHAQGPARALFGASSDGSARLLLYGFKVPADLEDPRADDGGPVLGIFVGVLPGLGGPNGVAILLPLTFTMDPTSAIVMLSCIYWGAPASAARSPRSCSTSRRGVVGGDDLRRLSDGAAGKGREALTPRSPRRSSARCRGAADHLPRARNRLLRAALRAAGVLRGLPAHLLLVRRPGREEKHKTIISMALGLLLAGRRDGYVSGQLRMTFGRTSCCAASTSWSR
jgi:hypothetical protein